MKRRVSLAIALTGDPKLIVLDEPSSGLDLVKRRQFWETIKNHSKNRAVILTTHLMEEADTLSDTIGIMTKGEMRCSGRSTKLRKSYSKGKKI